MKYEVVIYSYFFNIPEIAEILWHSSFLALQISAATAEQSQSPCILWVTSSPSHPYPRTGYMQSYSSLQVGWVCVSGSQWEHLQSTVSSHVSDVTKRRWKCTEQTYERLGTTTMCTHFLNTLFLAESQIRFLSLSSWHKHFKFKSRLFFKMMWLMTWAVNYIVKLIFCIVGGCVKHRANAKGELVLRVL